VASTLTYDQSKLSGIDDISNQNGVLTLVSGTNTPINEDNNVFIPAGSYQASSSHINIQLSASCNDEAGKPINATIAFTSLMAERLSDITNDNGALELGYSSSSHSVSTSSDDDDSDESEDDEDVEENEEDIENEQEDADGDAAGESGGESGGEAAGEAGGEAGADAAADSAAAAVFLCA
jgi:hypothetical protein